MSEQQSDAHPDVLNAQAQSRIKSFVERLERLIEDRDAIGGDIKKVFAELAGEGFDKKAVRAVLKYRKEDKAKRQELDALVDLYLCAIGGA